MNLNLNDIVPSVTGRGGLLFDSLARKHGRLDNDSDTRVARDLEVFRVLIEHSSDGVALIENNEVVYASEAFKKILGFDDISVFRTFEDIMSRLHPDDYELVKNKILESKKQHLKTQTYQFRFRRQDDSYCWVENSITRLYNKSGKNVRNVVISRDISDQKRAECELRKSEERFRALFSQNAMGIVAIDHLGRIIEANRRFCELLGSECGDILQVPFTSMVHPGDADFFDQIIQQPAITENNQPKPGVKKRLVREDGSIIWIEVFYSYISKNRNKAHSVILSVQDITWQKEAENALDTSRKTLQAIADNTTAFIYTKDKEGRYRFVNSALEKAFGKLPGEMIGKKDDELTQKETANHFRDNDLEVIRNGKPGIFEETKELPDGLHTAISVKVPLFDLQGEISGICGITTDITDRKKAEEELIDLKDKLELALSAGEMGIWEWYVEDNKVAWYGNHAQLYGISNDQFHGHAGEVRALTHPEDRDLATAAFRKTITTGAEFENTYRVVWPDKSTHWLYSYGNLVRNEYGKPYKVVGYTHDITTEKLARDKIITQNRELSQINSTKDKLFSVVSHDLMNPLNSLLGFTQLLEMNYQNASTESIGQYTRLISKSANAMADLLQTLSQWSMSQRGKIRVAPKTIHLSQLIDELSEHLSANFHNKRLSLQNEIPVDHIAYADEEMLRTVLRNLLNNAVKFSNPGGQIVAGSTLNGGTVIIRVSDQGVGIEADKLNKLFSVSSEVSTPGTAGEKGNGIGLIICKEFIGLNHGSIRAESTPGKGSDFYLEIPVNKKSWNSD